MTIHHTCWLPEEGQLPSHGGGETTLHVGNDLFGETCPAGTAVAPALVVCTTVVGHDCSGNPGTVGVPAGETMTALEVVLTLGALETVEGDGILTLAEARLMALEATAFAGDARLAFRDGVGSAAKSAGGTSWALSASSWKLMLLLQSKTSVDGWRCIVATGGRGAFALVTQGDTCVELPAEVVTGLGSHAHSGTTTLPPLPLPEASMGRSGGPVRTMHEGDCERIGDGCAVLGVEAVHASVMAAHASGPVVPAPVLAVPAVGARVGILGVDDVLGNAGCVHMDRLGVRKPRVRVRTLPGALPGGVRNGDRKPPGRGERAGITERALRERRMSQPRIGEAARWVSQTGGA